MIIKEVRNIETNELKGYKLDTLFVPLDSNNRHYREIQMLLKTGEAELIPAFTDEELVDYTKKQIEQRATNFVKKQLKELDYDNEGEVALYASNPESEWHDEAVALQKWVEDVYKKMYELIDSVTVDNYKDIDLDKIEAEYPAFEFNE